MPFEKKEYIAIPRELNKPRRVTVRTNVGNDFIQRLGRLDEDGDGEDEDDELVPIFDERTDRAPTARVGTNTAPKEPTKGILVKLIDEESLTGLTMSESLDVQEANIGSLIYYGIISSENGEYTSIRYMETVITNGEVVADLTLKNNKKRKYPILMPEVAENP